MSAAEYFDLSGDRANGLAVPGAILSSRQVEKVLTVELDSLMFTGRVPLSTWTFTVGIGSKLWISDRTTLYFGKELRFMRPVYQGKVVLDRQKANLDVAICAYNSYGDLLKSKQKLKIIALSGKTNPTGLIQIDQNWMQLLFKFRFLLEQQKDCA